MLTTEILNNAERDVSDLGDIVNGSAVENGTGLVTTRTGGDVRTVQKLFADIVALAAEELEEVINFIQLDGQSVGVGTLAGTSATDSDSSCYFGYGAGFDVDDCSEIVAIGLSAAEHGVGLTSSITIGASAGRNAQAVATAVMVGPAAGYEAENSIRMVAVGSNAAEQAKNAPNLVALGPSAARYIDGGLGLPDITNPLNSLCDGVVAIGYQCCGAVATALNSPSPPGTNLRYTNIIGYACARYLYDVNYGNIFGYAAGEEAYGSDDIIAIGRFSCIYGFNSDRIISIGAEAGLNASGSVDAILIGHKAGQSEFSDSVFGTPLAATRAIYIGKEAGLHARGTTDVICLGYNTDVTDATSNVIAIGANAAATTSNTIIFGRVGTHASRLKAGFGVVAPPFAVSVAADVAAGNYTDGNGQIAAMGATDNNKRTVLGYNTTNNNGFIQAGRVGTGVSAMALNPQGGNIGANTNSPTFIFQAAGDINGGEHTDGFAQICASGLTDPTKRIVMGVDTTANYGFLMSGKAGTSRYDTRINQFGGNVTIGGSVTASAALLHVFGNIGLQGSCWTGDSTRGYWIDTIGEFDYGIAKSAAGNAATLNIYANGIRYQIDASGHILPNADNGQDLGSGSKRMRVIYAGTGTINTSDADHKEQITAIPDEWLDAWGDVDWCRFKLRDAVLAKGDAARWHTGAVAQAVRDAFDARGLDAFGLGLLCYDEWEAREATPPIEYVPAVEEVHDEEGNVVIEGQAEVPGHPGNPGLEAGHLYGLRYEECFAMEAAYTRRRMDRLEALIAGLS